jgi:L-iditol 2-dehydrogenase
MRAILFEAPRQIRLIDDMPIPEPDEGEVLVRCTHLGLCGGNVGPYTGAGHWAEVDWPPPLGWQGHESVGIIAESGSTGSSSTLSQRRDRCTACRPTSTTRGRLCWPSRWRRSCAR